VHNEVTAATLSKIGLIKVNDEKWICKADYDSSNVQPAKAEEEEDNEDEEDDNADELMADTPQNDYGQYFMGFEERMMNQPHIMQEEGRTHHQYNETRFQDIENMVGDVQNKPSHMFFNPDD